LEVLKIFINLKPTFFSNRFFIPGCKLTTATCKSTIDWRYCTLQFVAAIFQNVTKNWECDKRRRPKQPTDVPKKWRSFTL